MSVILRKTQKCLARIPPLQKSRAVSLLTTAAEPLSYVFLNLAQLIVAIPSLTVIDCTALYALVSLARFIFPAIRTRLDDQATAITAALLLSLTLLAGQLGLMVLQFFNDRKALSWRRHEFGLGRAVLSAAFWCAMAMVVSDLGVRSWEICVSLLFAVMI